MTTAQDPIAHASRLLRETAEELRQALEDWEAAVGAGGVQALSAAPAGFVPVAAFDRLHAHAESLAARLLAAEQVAPKAAPDHPPMPENWGVVVSVNSENILCIGQDYLHGKRELSEAEELAIVGMAQHLLAFVGYGLPPSIFDPDDDAAPQQEAQEPTAISEAIERMAADRYKVVPSHESMFHRWAVVAGTGTQQLYLGREVECQNMARKFAGAFLDGAFVAMQQAAPQPAPAPLSDDVVRDAAFDAVRKKLCALPRFSFLSDGYGVRRVPDKAGSWIAFDAAHALFDPVAVDAALAAQGGK